jgi:iron complex outermembrane recepter protein
MSHRREKRARRAARNAFLTAVSLDVLAIAVPAGAQQPPADSQQTQTQTSDSTPSDDEVLQEVVVTGFRASLADALARKRESNQIVEAVTPEDLGKFPDQNIAESLQRLSGVQIDRIAGQGTQVRIRGLSQNVTLLDDDLFLTGLELYKLGEGNDRFNDSLEGIPSELIGGVDVYKSASADLVEGALGGTINLHLRRAIEMKQGFTAGGNLRFNRGRYSKETDPSGAFVAAYNFEDRWGVTASVSYDELAIHEDALSGANRANWRWIDAAGRTDPLGNPEAADPTEAIFDTAGQSYLSPELVYTTHRDQFRKRWGASLGLDFQPNDAMTFGFDWFHSNLDFSTEEVGNKVWFDSNNLGRGIDASQPFTIDANGTIREATMLALGAEVISLVQAAEAKSDNFQLSFKFNNDSWWNGAFKAAYSQADLVSDTANADVQHAPYSVPTPDASSPTGWSAQPSLNPSAPGGSTPYAFHYTNDGKLPNVQYLGSASDLLTNPAYAMFKSHWAFGDRSDNTAYSARADFKFQPPFLNAKNINFSAGARYSKRNVDFTSGRYLLDWSNQGEADVSNIPASQGGGFGPWFYFQDAAIGNKSCDFNGAVATPGLPAGVDTCARFGNSPLVVQPVQSATTNPGRVETINNFFPNGNVGSSIIAQSRAQMRNPAAWLQSLYPDQPMQFFRDEPESFIVDEKVDALYFMGDLGTPEDQYHINFGTRVVRTHQDIEQHAPVAGGRFWGSDSWNGVIRDFETVNTPRSYSDILPSMSLMLDLTEQQKLRFTAARVMSRPNLYDLGRGFQTFFTRTTVNGVEGFQFSGGSAGNPDLDPFRANQVDVSWEYYFGRQNAIILTGFWKEVDSFIGTRTAPEVVQDDFGGSPGAVTRPFNGKGGRIRGFELGAQYAFDFGFGFATNYTFSPSTSPNSTSFDSSLPIDGVAKHAFTMQAYYERAKFGSRLSYSWRDKTYRGAFGLNDGSATYGRFERPYGQLDGQISYQLTERFGVLLEAINITEEDRSQYLQFPEQAFTYNAGERRIFAGGRATF